MTRLLPPAIVACLVLHPYATLGSLILLGSVLVYRERRQL